MKSNLSYAHLMEAEILKKFFDGKLTSEENDYFTTLLADDELLREAFAGLNAESFNVVESISIRSNNKIDKLISSPPILQRWTFWLSVFIGIILISVSAIYFYPNKENNEQLAVVDDSNNESENETKSKKQKKEKTDNSNKEEKTITTNDNTLEFNKENNSILSMEMLHQKEDKKQEEKLIVNTDNSSNTDEGPNENKVNEEKKVNEENNTGNTSVVKKKTRLRLSEAMVLISQNLAEKEESSSSNRNHDVRDPNIGNSVTTKKSNGFKIEDMPSYPGGTDALNAYVKGRLSTKSYAIDVSGISTTVEFVVTSKGKVEQIKLQNKIDSAVEKDVIDVLSNLKFNPGKKSGKKGSMHYMMALVYQ